MSNLISVIVPVYNVEKYLHKCIDSIINQTYKNLEIILVDDGSTDESGKICDKYKEADNRITVIHKKNGGLSDARNAGLKAATGDFIAFADSDDWIDTNAYNEMITVLTDNNADISACNIAYIFEDKTEVPAVNISKNIFTAEEAIGQLICGIGFRAVAWNKLYRKSCINNMSFEAGKTHEDEFFTYKVLANAEKLVFINKPLYFYRQRSTSIMGEKYSLKRLDAVDACYERLLFFKDKYPNLYKNDKITFTNMLILNYQMILKNKSIDPDKTGRKKLISYRKALKYKFSEWKSLKFKDKIYITLSDISLSLCSSIKNIFHRG